MQQEKWPAWEREDMNKFSSEESSVAVLPLLVKRRAFYAWPMAQRGCGLALLHLSPRKVPACASVRSDSKSGNCFALPR